MPCFGQIIKKSKSDCNPGGFPIYLPEIFLYGLNFLLCSYIKPPRNIITFRISAISFLGFFFGLIEISWFFNVHLFGKICSSCFSGVKQTKRIDLTFIAVIKGTLMCFMPLAKIRKQTSAVLHINRVETHSQLDFSWKKLCVSAPEMNNKRGCYFPWHVRDRNACRVWLSRSQIKLSGSNRT